MAQHDWEWGDERIAQLEAENAELREERKVLLATLEFMQSDRDAWQAAHNALVEGKQDE